MAILGVLLGITMCAVAWVIKQTLDNTPLIVELQNKVTILERRKAVVAEAVAGQPKPAGVAQVKLRTWNEDAPFVEKAKG
jgi:hypothetical protein